MRKNWKKKEKRKKSTIFNSDNIMVEKTSKAQF